MLFIGFAGKAYDRMIDRTIDKPQIGAKPGSDQSFKFGDYSFTYENLFHTSDDHKDAFTAQVSIWIDGEKIATVYPAKWDYHKADGNLISQVAITPRYLPWQFGETPARVTSTSCSPATTSTRARRTSASTSTR